MSFEIKLEEITFAYGRREPVLQNFNLTIYKGERLGIAGASGCGKSTLLLLINGSLKQNRGSIYLNGNSTPATTDELRSYTATLFQEPDDQLFAPSVIQDVTYSPFVRTKQEEDEVRQEAIAVLNMLNLSAYAERPIHALSYGQKKRVALASLFILEPSAIALDEPTAGLDPAGIENLMEVFKTQVIKGRTMIAVSHEKYFLKRFATRLVVLKDGTLFAEGEPNQILDSCDTLQKCGLYLPPVELR